MEQDEILILTLVGSISGIVMLMLKLCFKSKCSHVNLCCGLMKIKREVQFETELETEKDEPKPKQKEAAQHISMPELQPQTEGV